MRRVPTNSCCGMPGRKDSVSTGPHNLQRRLPHEANATVPTDRATHDRLTAVEALALADCDDLDPLLRRAARRRDLAHGDVISYSRKVFIPLTRLCRDCCSYCTFARPPRGDAPSYLSPEQILEIAA